MADLGNFMTSEIGDLCQISAWADPFNIQKLCMKIRYEILGTSGYIRKEEKVTQFFRRRGLLVFIAHL